MLVIERPAEGIGSLKTQSDFDVQGFADQMAEGQVGWVLFYISTTNSIE